MDRNETERLKETLDAAIKKAELADEKCADSDKIIEELKLTIENKNKMIESLRRSMNRYENDLAQVYNSRGYKLAMKLSGVAKVIVPRDSLRFKIAKKVYCFFSGIFKRSTGSVDPFGTTPEEQFRVLTNTKKINIRTVMHTMYIAEALQKILVSCGYECDISVGDAPYEKKVPYIMICAQMFKSFPSVYIVYQMEQTVSSRWLNDQYLNILESAYAVFDYSPVNVRYFSTNNIISKKMFYVPIDFVPEYRSLPKKEKEYDVLFCGDVNNERRKTILNAIGEKYNVKVINNLFGEQLYDEIAKAKVVLNIHYYENALLETTRVYETLSVYPSIVVSERSSDEEEENKLDGVVDFVPVGDINAIMSRIEYWLCDDERRESEATKRQNTLRNRPNAFEFYFKRFLLANDLIEYDDFYNTVGNYVTFNKDCVCLNLPEAVERKDSFTKDAKIDFQFMPGLKHRAGWMGCAMSYKFIAQKALEQGMDKLLICEDDVLFPDNFSERYENIKKYLSENDDWDMFSGIMADTERANVCFCEDKYGETMVQVDRMVSTVFNCYKKRMLEALAGWTKKADVYTNTIDRYLEKDVYKIFTTSPFLVGHKEDMMSTIWNFSNSTYNEWIEKSSKRISEMVKEYKEKQ